METNPKLVEHFNLQNNSVLVTMESTISSIQLNVLLNEGTTPNSKTMESFYKELGSSPKTIVAVSEKVQKEYPSIKVGDIALFNSYGNPVSVINTEDPMDLDNVLELYREVEKDKPKFTQTLVSDKYKVRAYYIYEAHAILTTLSK